MLKLNEVVDEYKPFIAQLLMNNVDIFSSGDDYSTTTDLVFHKIPTIDSPPIKQTPYRIPYAQRQVIKENVDKMIRQKIIRPSNSSWSSPVVLAKKKDNTERFCIDYRKLNNLTLKDNYPLPRVDDIFDNIGQCKIFKTIDLDRGYWQIKVDEADKHKTAFTSYLGLY